MMPVTMLPSARPASPSSGRRPARATAARLTTRAGISQAAAGQAAISQPPAAAAWPALGTTAALAVTDPTLLAAARDLLAAELAAVDAACSTFRSDSELVAVNAAARRQDGPVRISPLLADAIGAALRAAEQTGGDVDPVAGPAVAAGPPNARAAVASPPITRPATSGPGTSGPGTSEPGTSEPGTFGPGTSGLELAAGRRSVTWTLHRGTPGCITVAVAVSWRQVSLDQDNGLLTLPPDSWLDLGATAKAWAADRAAAAIAARLGCGVLVSLGGDVAASGQPPRGGWRIRVHDNAGHAAGRAGAGTPAGGPGAASRTVPSIMPPAVPSAVVSIRGGGLATAGPAAARWRRGGDVLAHILRPDGLVPASASLRLASVTAASCAEARAASTAAIIRGGGAIGWLSGLGLPARLVDDAGRVRTVAGWPADIAADGMTGAGEEEVGR